MFDLAATSNKRIACNISDWKTRETNLRGDRRDSNELFKEEIQIYHYFHLLIPLSRNKFLWTQLNIEFYDNVDSGALRNKKPKQKPTDCFVRRNEKTAVILFAWSSRRTLLCSRRVVSRFRKYLIHRTRDFRFSIRSKMYIFLHKPIRLFGQHSPIGLCSVVLSSIWLNGDASSSASSCSVGCGAQIVLRDLGCRSSRMRGSSANRASVNCGNFCFSSGALLISIAPGIMEYRLTLGND